MIRFSKRPYLGIFWPYFNLDKLLAQIAAVILFTILTYIHAFLIREAIPVFFQ